MNPIYDCGGLNCKTCEPRYKAKCNKCGKITSTAKCPGGHICAFCKIPGAEFSDFPVRTEIEILPADDPNKLEQLGWAITESVGMGVVNTKGIGTDTFTTSIVTDTATLSTPFTWTINTGTTSDFVDAGTTTVTWGTDTANWGIDNTFYFTTG